MITADRFLAARHIDEDAWHAARKTGVTATAVADIAGRKTDRAVAIDLWMEGAPVEPNAYMQFGTESENALVSYAHTEHGILPTDWVIAGTDHRHLATPDGLSLDHTTITEAKTTGDPWDGAETNIRKIPIRYRRQVQWQLHVTGADRCLFLWQLRVEDGGWFRFGWFQPRWVWIERDDAMVADLITVSDDMLAARELRRAA